MNEQKKTHTHKTKRNTQNEKQKKGRKKEAFQFNFCLRAQAIRRRCCQWSLSSLRPLALLVSLFRRSLEQRSPTRRFRSIQQTRARCLDCVRAVPPSTVSRIVRRHSTRRRLCFTNKTTTEKKRRLGSDSRRGSQHHEQTRSRTHTNLPVLPTAGNFMGKELFSKWLLKWLSICLLTWSTKVNFDSSIERVSVLIHRDFLFVASSTG